jgi:hypothetical protein
MSATTAGSGPWSSVEGGRDVMSMHKLTAGSGYEYLTRQVARNDAAVPSRTPLADYYDEQGEAPGVWVGSGLTGIDGLAEATR